MSHGTPYQRPRRQQAAQPAYATTAPVGPPCVCGKRVHRSRKSAKTFVTQQHPGHDLRPYECPRNPGAWHIGTLPSPIVAGRQPRTFAAQADR